MPKYREDAKGKIPALKAECVDMMRGNIATSDCFTVLPEDCECYDEYSQYLTEKELADCFKKALRA